MLQGGPMPMFLDTSLVDKMLVGENAVLSASEQQFRNGLNIVGVIDVSRTIQLQ